MNLYEELGLRTSASPQDIRKAHRTLSRLLHPDQQMDADLRQAAELQMRRINAMAGILLDPEQRRRYDESLRYVISPPSPAAKPRPATRYPSSVFDLISIAVAAVIITLIAIWLVAGEFIHWKATTSSVVSLQRFRVPLEERTGPRGAAYNEAATRRTWPRPARELARFGLCASF